MEQYKKMYVLWIIFEYVIAHVEPILFYTLFIELQIIIIVVGLRVHY